MLAVEHSQSPQLLQKEKDCCIRVVNLGKGRIDLVLGQQSDGSVCFHAHNILTETFILAALSAKGLSLVA